MKKVLARLLAASLGLSLAACGKEPEPVIEKTTEDTTVTVTETKPQGWEGSYQSSDTEEHFTIYDVTDKGFKVEFYHYE